MVLSRYFTMLLMMDRYLQVFHLIFGRSGWCSTREGGIQFNGYVMSPRNPNEWSGCLIEYLVDSENISFRACQSYVIWIRFI